MLALGGLVLFGIAAAGLGLYFFYPQIRSFLPVGQTKSSTSQETQQTPASGQQSPNREVGTPTASTPETTTSETYAEFEAPGAAPAQTIESSASLPAPGRDTVMSSASLPTGQTARKPPVKSLPTQTTAQAPASGIHGTTSDSVPTGAPSSGEPEVSSAPPSVSRPTDPDVIPVEPPSASPGGEAYPGQSQSSPTSGYTGPQEGVIIWTGEVDKGETVFIEGSSASNGQVRGSLPGVPCLLELSAPNVAVTEAPGPRNRYQKVGLRFAKKGRFSISLKWRIAR